MFYKHYTVMLLISMRPCLEYQSSAGVCLVEIKCQTYFAFYSADFNEYKMLRAYNQAYLHFA